MEGGGRRRREPRTRDGTVCCLLLSKILHRRHHHHHHHYQYCHLIILILTKTIITISNINYYEKLFWFFIALNVILSQQHCINHNNLQNYQIIFTQNPQILKPNRSRKVCMCRPAALQFKIFVILLHLVLCRNNQKGKEN